MNRNYSRKREIDKKIEDRAKLQNSEIEGAVQAYYDRCIKSIDKEFAPQSQNKIFPMITKKRAIEILKEELTK